MRGRVVWVVDGDTIHAQIEKRRARVRDIAVNALEIPACGERLVPVRATSAGSGRTGRV